MKVISKAALLVLALASSITAAQESPLDALPRHVVLSPQQHVSGQPTEESLRKLKSSGITTVIDLRPDAETPDLDEKVVATESGLKYRSLPIAGAADLTRANVATFDQMLKDSANEKVLVHCASGNRVGAMLALRAHWLEGKSAEEALEIGKAAGMTSLADAVKARLAAGE